MPGWARALALAGSLITLIVIVVVALLVSGTATSSSSRGGVRTRPQGRAPRAPKAPAAPPGFTSFSDTAAGFSIAYPSSWARVASTDKGVPLLAKGPGAEQALLVRVTTGLGLSVSKVTVRGLPALRPLTDRLVHADARARLLLRPAEVQVGGLPGWVYVYAQVGGAPSSRVAHIQYFLFAGTTLITLVFQATHADRLTADAPTFGRIAKTFKSMPPASPPVHG